MLNCMQLVMKLTFYFSDWHAIYNKHLANTTGLFSEKPAGGVRLKVVKDFT